MACRADAEKVTHGLRICIEEHWSDDNSVAFKVDMRNAFNVVPRQTVVEECATFSPEIVMVLWVTSSVMAPYRSQGFNREFPWVSYSLHWSCRN